MHANLYIYIYVYKPEESPALPEGGTAPAADADKQDRYVTGNLKVIVVNCVCCILSHVMSAAF